MLFILYAIFFQYLALFCFAFVDLPQKPWRDGSKAAFVQVPFISTIRDTKLLQLQKDISQLWPKGVVRYYIDKQSYDTIINSSLKIAMIVIEYESCIEFQEESQKPTDNKTWLHFTNPYKERACVHEPQYKQKGEIVLTLGYDCLRYRDILHTLLHGIGFKDEVTHPHRDKYIKIIWNNIHPSYQNLFIKEPTDSVRSSVEYDPSSVMHFHDRAYSINGKATILTLEPGLQINPSESLSQLDRMRLRMYFGHECNKRNVNHLLDSCKMTLQNKGGPKKKDEGTKKLSDKQNAEEYNDDEEEVKAAADGKTEENQSNDDLEHKVLVYDETSKDDDNVEGNVAVNDNVEENVAVNDNIEENVAVNDNVEENVAVNHNANENENNDDDLEKDKNDEEKKSKEEHNKSNNDTNKPKNDKSELKGKRYIDSDTDSDSDTDY